MFSGVIRSKECKIGGDIRCILTSTSCILQSQVPIISVNGVFNGDLWECFVCIVYTVLQFPKKLYKQVQKTFCKKNGEE